MFRPVTPLSDKDMEGAGVDNMDFIKPNAVPNFDDVLNIGLPSQVGRAAGCFNPCGGEEAKRQRVFGGEMDSFLPNAVLTCDFVPDIGLSSEVGCAAGGLNPSGRVEEKIPTMLGWRCDDGGMDFVLPSAVPDIVPNNGHLLDRRAGSSHPRGGVKKFTPAFEEANSPKEKCENKILTSIKKAWNNFMHPVLHNDKVETLIPSELNADLANPTLKDDAGLASSELKTKIKPDKRKAFFGCLWRGKVESVPTPQLTADPAIPDVREVVDLASQSKADVGPKKKKQKASKSRKSNLQVKKVTVVPTQQPKAISDIPVGMDVPDLAGPQSKTKIRPDERKTWTQRILGCFQRGKVESMPTSQIEADPAIPDAREVRDLADSQSKIVGLKKNKKKASKSRSFHNPLSKKGKSKVKKDADPAIPDAMDGADLASFGDTAAANARLQKIGAIPENIGLKGGGNPDPNKAKNPGSKDAGNPEAEDGRNPRAKDLGNPRHFRFFHQSVVEIPENPDPNSAKSPGPKEDPGAKATKNPTHFIFVHQSVEEIPENPDPNTAQSPGPKEDPGAKAAENPEDDRVVRPKILNVFDPPVPKETLYSKYYFLNEVIGRGGFGKVFKGIRISDDIPVAIKRIFKRDNEGTLYFPGYPKPLITEVALMLKLKEAPSCPNVIQLYDWYETRFDYMLVLEYPLHCESLWDFVNSERQLSENIARHLMRQAVLAVKHCLDNGVFHTDIHPKNFLVEKFTMNLKLIDFGLGHYLKDEEYFSYAFKGAAYCTPPEIHTELTYYAVPANVWALGVLLYFMVLGTVPFPLKAFYSGKLKRNEKGLSNEICDLIKQCMAKNPSDRLTLEQILDHDWFKTESYEGELLYYQKRAPDT